MISKNPYEKIKEVTQKKQIQIYQNNKKQFLSGRQAEIYALRQMVQRLSRSTNMIQKELNHDHMEVFKKDLRDNQKIWTFFQTSLIKNETNIQEPLRTQLLTLCAFVDHRTLDILSTAIGKFNPSSVNMLIQINQEIADGLEEIDKNALQEKSKKTNEKKQQTKRTIA